MATVNSNAPISEVPETVRVGLVLSTIPVEKDCVGVSEDGHGINFTSGRNEEKKLFPFDQVVTVDNIQSLHPELLQPLVDSISSSSNGALLICGASTEKICTLIDHCIIKQILANVFSHMSSQVKEDLFISVSFLQFYPDGTAVDRLSPNRQTLKLLTLPVLGRCSSLFSVAFEWKLHPEEVGSEICCSRLQLFSLAGGASRADLRGVNPLVKVMEQIPHGATTSDKLLPHLLYEALTGNSQTVLIYCINPQGLLDDETPSALTLAQKVRSIATKATVVHWCPRATEQQIRDNIMDLQTTIMSDGENEVHNTYKLAELMHNLQNCKSLDGEQQDRESTDTIKYLQDQLRQEMEEHIREGKGNVEKIQQRVARIQKLKEAVREETQKIRVATEKSDFCQDVQ
ncbi:Kinesin-like protein KIF17 KIF3-related motor protein [Channa argus]|uniref:Kinesin-like protein KIF17 KIF3-related motor protein n=1 Tax=Channa argus TaxID=215402 RepID=A0A6G1PUI9_CHAAH|nr:Kinesin-like protein KIF17 KIF3-related motor protein [Channa argus]